MSSRYPQIAALYFAVALSVGPLVARAQIVDAANGGAAQTPDIETSNMVFAGEVNTEGTRVHSGPSENDYPVVKLAKGTRLTVVGMRNDWLKVEPPEGAFCLVPQAFVDKFGKGNAGRVIDNPAVVRIGSALVPNRHKVPFRLDPGAEVAILGTDAEFYKIVPPKGVYLYVDKRFVDPVKRLDAAAAATPAKPELPVEPPKPETGSSANAEGTPKPTDVPPSMQQPGAPGNERFVVRSTEGAPESAPTTQQTAAVTDQIRELQEKLVAVEDRYAAASKQEITEQPIDALLTDYEALLANPALPPNAKRVAEFRAQSLKVRKETVTQLAEAKRIQAEAAAEQAELAKQQKVLQAKVAETSIKRYAAVGRLASSSLRAGTEPLYRLVDPANGRTILYVRPAAGKPVTAALNQFVAVNGKVVNDEAMKITYIEPDGYESIDPKLVNKKVFAEYAPPSMTTANLVTAEVQGN